MGSVPTSLGEWIHSPWFDLGLMVWKGYRPRVRLVLGGAMLLRGFRLFGVALQDRQADFSPAQLIVNTYMVTLLMVTDLPSGCVQLTMGPLP